MLPDQAVHRAGIFHVRQIGRLRQDVQRHAGGQRLGVRHRNDPVVTTSDQLHRACQGGERGAQIERLTAAGESGVHDRF